MSKAFTREDDTAEEALPEPAGVPSGVRNLITPAGLERLRDELHQLRRVERPKVVATVSWAAGNGDRSENGDYIYGKRRLRQIDGRITVLAKRLRTAEPIDPARQTNRDQVFFGATVTYADESGNQHTVRIVGADEVGHVDGDVSWTSPIARAMMRARAGDVVESHTPSGPKAIAVIKIAYGKA